MTKHERDSGAVQLMWGPLVREFLFFRKGLLRISGDCFALCTAKGLPLRLCLHRSSLDFSVPLGLSHRSFPGISLSLVVPGCKSPLLNPLVPPDLLCMGTPVSEDEAVTRLSAEHEGLQISITRSRGSAAVPAGTPEGLTTLPAHGLPMASSSGSDNFGFTLVDEWLAGCCAGAVVAGRCYTPRHTSPSTCFEEQWERPSSASSLWCCCSGCLALGTQLCTLLLS